MHYMTIMTEDDNANWIILLDWGYPANENTNCYVQEFSTREDAMAWAQNTLRTKNVDRIVVQKNEVMKYMTIAGLYERR